MSLIANISACIKSPRLSLSVLSSKRTMQKYCKENVFNSKTLKELFTDKFKYNGKEPNTILVKNRQTSQPEPVRVVFRHSNIHNRETFLLKDLNNKNVGYKEYGLSSNPEIGCHMSPGLMSNNSNNILEGIGIRADQLQIERALQNGITKIPLASVAESTLFHTKMGFLPVQGSLAEVKTYKIALEYIKKYAEKSPDINPLNFKPIIIKKDGKFFIDLNKTQANANIKELKQRLKQNGGYKTEGEFKAPNVEMQLSGKELEQWKKLIEKQPVLPTLDFDFPIFK